MFKGAIFLLTRPCSCWHCCGCTCWTVLYSTCFQALPFEKTKVAKRSSETTYYIGVDDKQDRLLYYNTDSGVRDEEIRVKKSLLRRFPNVTIHNHMEDVHVYICSPWIMDVLASQGDLQSFQYDLVPYLVKRQFRRNFLEKCR
jgi:hypothetical protein